MTKKELVAICGAMRNARPYRDNAERKLHAGKRDAADWLFVQWEVTVVDLADAIQKATRFKVRAEEFRLECGDLAYAESEGKL